MKRILASLIFAFSVISAFANVGVFGGVGANIELVSNAEIQMVSEDVAIKLVPSEAPVTGSLNHLDEARYDCRFVMRNLSDKPEKVKMGFPISGGDNFMARGSGDKIAKHEFKVWVNDKEVPATYSESTADKKFGNIFLWECEFAPKEEKQLRVSYKTFGYIGLGSLSRRELLGNSFDFPRALVLMDAALVQGYEYITLTGNSWSGKIENAKFTLNIGEFERYLQKRGYLAEDEKRYKLSNGKHVVNDRNLLFRNGLTHRHLSSSYHWKPSPDGESLVAQLSPFEPKENIRIAYFFTIVPKDAEALQHLFNVAEKSFARSKEEFSKEDKKLIADLILEFYGVKTDNKAVKKFLDAQVWYPPQNPPKLDDNLKSELLKLSGN